MSWFKLAVVEWRENEYNEGVVSLVYLKNANETVEPIIFKMIKVSDGQQIGDGRLSVFSGGANVIMPAAYDENGHWIEIYDDFEIWINDTEQSYTEAQFSVYDGAITTVDVSTPCLQGVEVLRVADIGLQTLIGLPSLTDLSILGIRRNSMTSEQVNAIILDLFEYAINTLKEDGNLFLLFSGYNDNQPPTGDGLLALEALKGKGWVVDGQSGAGVTNIKNVYDLQAMILNRSGSYKLCNDIEAEETENWNDGAGFRKIGETPSTSFNGSFDGCGHIVKNLYIKPQIKGWTRDYVGLFGNFEKCTIKNVGIENISVYGRYYCGAIGECTSGAAGNVYTIENVWATGKVVGESYNGGLFGRMYNALSIVKNIWCDVDVVNNATLLPSINSGSIAVRFYCQFINSHSQNKDLPVSNWVGDTATITGIKQSKNSPDWESGKAVSLALLRHYNGKHYAATKALSAAENITSPDLSEDWRELDITTLTAAEFKGKYNFEGWDFEDTWAMGKDYPILKWTVLKLEAILGGFCGECKDGTTTSCYWDIDRSGNPTDNCNATPLTLQEAKNKSSYTDWDFKNTWNIAKGFAQLKNYISGAVSQQAIQRAVLRVGRFARTTIRGR